MINNSVLMERMSRPQALSNTVYSTVHIYPTDDTDHEVEGILRQSFLPQVMMIADLTENALALWARASSPIQLVSTCFFSYFLFLSVFNNCFFFFRYLTKKN